MAGMLPGVESARSRRRFHRSSVSFDSSSSRHWSTRRSSLCLYTTNHNNESHHFFTLQRNQISRAAGYEDEKLDEAAREAKERLDEKLNNNALWKSQNKRVSKDCEEQKHLNVFRLMKKNSGLLKRFNWHQNGNGNHHKEKNVWFAWNPSREAKPECNYHVLIGSIQGV